MKITFTATEESDSRFFTEALHEHELSLAHSLVDILPDAESPAIPK